MAAFTCPMHPEVRESAPGACPDCGMALESSGVSIEEGNSPELIDMSRRLWIAVVLTLPVFVISMSEMIPGFSRLL